MQEINFRKESNQINKNRITFNQPLIKKNIPASATVEGALVIPIFIYAVFAVMFMMHVIAIRTQVNDALYNSIRKFNRYAYVYESIDSLSEKDKESVLKTLKQKEDDVDVCKNTIDTAAFITVFISEIGTDFAGNNFVVGGNAGWNFIGTEILNGDSAISVTLKYRIKNPFNIFGTSYISISEQKITDAWLGEKYKKQYEGDDSKCDDIVYITQTGTVYHTHRDCPYIVRNIQSCNISEITGLRNEAGAKYYRCSKCMKDSKTLTVYYTYYGKRYHSKADCAGLQRNVIEVNIDKVSDRKLCSRCYYVDN